MLPRQLGRPLAGQWPKRGASSELAGDWLGQNGEINSFSRLLSVLSWWVGGPQGFVDRKGRGRGSSTLLNCRGGNRLQQRDSAKT